MLLVTSVRQGGVFNGQKTTTFRTIPESVLEKKKIKHQYSVSSCTTALVIILNSLFIDGTYLTKTSNMSNDPQTDTTFITISATNALQLTCSLVYKNVLYFEILM